MRQNVPERHLDGVLNLRVVWDKGLVPADIQASPVGKVQSIRLIVCEVELVLVGHPRSKDECPGHLYSLVDTQVGYMFRKD